jgi:hypothetical protein
LLLAALFREIFMPEITYPFEYGGFRLDQDGDKTRVSLLGKEIKFRQTDSKGTYEGNQQRALLIALVLAQGEIVTPGRLYAAMPHAEETSENNVKLAVQDKFKLKKVQKNHVKVIINHLKKTLAAHLAELGYDDKTAKTPLIKAEWRRGYQLFKENLLALAPV